MGNGSAKKKPEKPGACFNPSPKIIGVLCSRDKGHTGHHSFRTSGE